MLISPDTLKEQKFTTPALLRLGFRPFFMLAALYAVLIVINWTGIYAAWWQAPQQDTMSTTLWHAHEMMYGYGIAVIAGFLLTAIKNWTGQQTIHGIPLAMLAGLWIFARVGANLPMAGSAYAMMMADILFGLWLCFECAKPVIKARKWEQAGIIAKLALICGANVWFYIGWLQGSETVMRWSIDLGLYLVLALIVTMGRRVIPFFIEKGIGGGLTLPNPAWLDRASLPLFLVFTLVEVFTPYHWLAAALAGVLTALYLTRVKNWYARGLWQRPLLWSLYLSQVFIVIGFALSALRPWYPAATMPALHAFAYGGFGMVTLAMMPRVSWGHAGRDVSRPPKGLGLMFVLLLLGASFRVLLPLLLPGFYQSWILAAQLCWISAFSILFVIFVPVWLKPRLDGSYG